MPRQLEKRKIIVVFNENGHIDVEMKWKGLIAGCKTMETFIRLMREERNLIIKDRNK